MINQGKTQKMDELVNLVLKQMGLYQQYKEQEIAEIWKEVVGNMIATRTKSLRMTDGKLFVSFTSSVVRNEVSLVKEGIMSALNEKAGEKIVKEIIIR